MKAVVKKLKQKKRSDIEKIKDTLSDYPFVHIVENSDIPNPAIQKMRTTLDGKVLFIKKAIFQKEYPCFQLTENYFLIFGKDNITQQIEAFVYPDFLQAGGSAPEHVVVPAGIVRNPRVAALLPNTVMQGGNRVLLEDFVVCEENAQITDKQAQILQAMGTRLGQSSLKVLDVKGREDLK